MLDVAGRTAVTKKEQEQEQEIRRGGVSPNRRSRQENRKDRSTRTRRTERSIAKYQNCVNKFQHFANYQYKEGVGAGEGGRGAVHQFEV